MSRCSKSFLRVGGGGRREVVREQRVGGSSTRFPLSRWWGGFLVCRWRRHYESGRWLEWTVRASRESASKEKKKNQHTTTTNSKNESIKNHKRKATRFRLFSLDWPSAFQLCQFVVCLCRVFRVSLINWIRKSDLKSWRNHVECSSACLAHTHTHSDVHTLLITHTK